MRQGDPLGPLFFSLGYWRSVLREAAKKFTDVTFLAYIDDTYFICRRSQGGRILNFLKYYMGKVGLRLSLGPSGKVVCLDPSPGANPGMKAGGYQVVSDGIKVLGGPVSFGISAGCGDGTFRAKFLDKELKKCTMVLEVLHRLSAQPAYWLLAQCVNARVSYLCRISAPWLIAKHLNDFDDKVDACLAKIIDLQDGLPAIACIIRGLPGKLGGGCIRRSRDVSACGFSASFLNAMFIIQESCPVLWRQAWASKRNPILPHCGILSRTVPYFVGFAEGGSQWARPSTDEEILERMEAEDADHQAQPGAERRRSTMGPMVDSHLEALVIMRKLLTQGRSDVMDEGVSAIRESQATKAGFANSGDRDAWIALMDDAEDHLDDYEHFRGSARASRRGRDTVAEFGQVREGDWAVTERVPYRWRQSGLQAFRDLCQFARAARMLPGDSGYRASFLSNERVGGSAHLQYGSEEADSWDNQLFVESLKQTLCIPLGIGEPGETMECMCRKRVVMGPHDEHHVECRLASEGDYARSREITALVRNALLRTWGAAISFSDEREVRTPDRRRSGCYADLVFTLNGNKVWVDVTVINPATLTGRANGSLLAGGRAAAAKEHQKFEKYAKATGVDWTLKHFVALAFESTGRPGKSANAFVTKYITYGPSFRKYPHGCAFRPSTISPSCVRNRMLTRSGSTGSTWPRRRR